MLFRRIRGTSAASNFAALDCTLEPHQAQQLSRFYGVHESVESFRQQESQVPTRSSSIFRHKFDICRHLALLRVWVIVLIARIRVLIF